MGGILSAPVPHGSMGNKDVLGSNTGLDLKQVRPSRPHTDVCAYVYVCACMPVCGLAWPQLSKVGVCMPKRDFFVHLSVKSPPLYLWVSSPMSPHPAVSRVLCWMASSGRDYC